MKGSSSIGPGKETHHNVGISSYMLGFRVSGGAAMWIDV